MTTRTTSWTPRERLLTGLCLVSLGFSIAAYFDFGGSAGAAPRGDGPITSADIPKGTIRGSDIAGATITTADVRNGSLRAADLDIYNAFGRSAYVPNVPGTFEYSRAECRLGDRVLSGGYATADPETVVVSVTEPDLVPPDSWYVRMDQTGQFDAFFTPIAVCMN